MSEIYSACDISLYRIVKAHVMFTFIISVCAKHGSTLGIHSVQDKGTFHCLVGSWQRCCNLRLFDHSEWLSFSFIGVRLNASYTFLLWFATTTTKERIDSNINIKGSIHQNHKITHFSLEPSDIYPCRFLIICLLRFRLRPQHNEGEYSSHFCLCCSSHGKLYFNNLSPETALWREEIGLIRT